MPLRIVQVDAFTNQPFTGNPAAVCVLPAPKSDAWMQAVALEMNLSETAFLIAEAGGFHLRWFTPTIEVDLCGHATLASAHVLWEDGHLPQGSPAIFRTRSGELSATRSDGWITLDFPAQPVERPIDPTSLAEALGWPVVAAGKSRFDVLVEVASAADVRAIRLDGDLTAKIEAIDARGVIVTARSDKPGFDFVSRFFGPRCGVPEDPVTGSAHCVLGPHWAARLGKSQLVGSQVSSRGGIVRVELLGDRALLGGQAVTVVRSELVDDLA